MRQGAQPERLTKQRLPMRMGWRSWSMAITI
jgi:hypothetical protein